MCYKYNTTITAVVLRLARRSNLNVEVVYLVTCLIVEVVYLTCLIVEVVMSTCLIVEVVYLVTCLIVEVVYRRQRRGSLSRHMFDRRGSLPRHV